MHEGQGREQEQTQHTALSLLLLEAPHTSLLAWQS